MTSTGSVSARPTAPPAGVRGLRLIAAFKLVKATALIAAALGFLGVWGPQAGHWVQHGLEALALRPGHHLAARLAEQALALLDAAGPSRRHALAAGAFLYATIFLVEAYGLARSRRWAVYLTLAITISFLPLEMVALWHRWTLPRVGTLVLNGAVVVYLLLQLRTGRAALLLPADADGSAHTSRADERLLP